MLFVTFFGKHSFLIPAFSLLLLYFVYSKNKHLAVVTAVISIGGVSLMGLLKNLFARQRPSFPMVDGITNYGFPSGHAMMGVAFYGLLIIFCFLYIKNKWIKIVSVNLLLLFILMIGFSRIYLRVHYTTDVMAGYSFGTFWLCLCLYVTGRVGQNHHK